jgi:predicted NBD/HSP70 family sugar kinase
MVLATPASAAWPELGETERRVLLELLLRGAQSRVRISETLGLSRTSLTRAARDLVDRGMVEEGAMEVRSTRGRPAEILHLRPDAAHFVGVKLTGDALYVVLTGLSARIVDEVAVPLPSRDVDDVVGLIGEVVARITAGVERAAAIGVGLAGDVTVRGSRVLVERSHFLGWDGVPLTELVGAATGLPATVVNDVQALAGAHRWFGGLDRHRSLVVYGIGAGIGSAVVLDDELVTGSHGRAGRVGHSRIDAVGRTCENGHSDCVHSFVTMGAIAHNAGLGPDRYPEALAAARRGEATAVEAFRLAAFALGVAIAESVNTLDPEIVTVMGEGLDMLDIAPDEVKRALAEYLEQGEPDAVRIDRPPFDFDLYARGAAVAAMRELLS